MLPSAFVTHVDSGLANGIAFYYLVDDLDFLVSARHNFVGKHWQTSGWLSTNHPGVEPTHVRVRIREKPPEGGYTSAQPIQFGYVLSGLGLRASSGP